MSFLTRIVFGRWFARWVLRGGPWSVFLKLAGVALWGVWRWRRQERRRELERRRREIPADYEVVPEGRLEPGKTARNLSDTTGYRGDDRFLEDRESHPSDPGEEK